MSCVCLLLLLLLLMLSMLMLLLMLLFLLFRCCRLFEAFTLQKTQQGFRTGFWLGLLAAHFETKCDIVNRGYSGYNTDLAVSSAFDRAFGDVVNEPLFVTVCFGANDSALPFSNQHVPLERFKANMEIICRRLQDKWLNLVIVVIAPPPVDDAKWTQHCKNNYNSDVPNRNAETSQLYRDACAAVATERNALFVDLWDGRLAKDNCSSDGLHLTPEGNLVLFGSVMEVLPQSVLKVEPAFPYWLDLLNKK